MYPPMIPRIARLIEAARDVAGAGVYHPDDRAARPRERIAGPDPLQPAAAPRQPWRGRTAAATRRRDRRARRSSPSSRSTPGDLVVKKYRSSGFWGTNLDMLLRSNGIKSVVITGCTTEGCVESTARDALFNDYYVVIVEDCVASDDRAQHEASLLLDAQPLRHRRIGRDLHESGRTDRARSSEQGMNLAPRDRRDLVRARRALARHVPARGARRERAQGSRRTARRAELRAAGRLSGRCASGSATARRPARTHVRHARVVDRPQLSRLALLAGGGRRSSRRRPTTACCTHFPSGRRRADGRSWRGRARPRALRRLRRRSPRPRFLYVLPTFHNPTGLDLDAGSAARARGAGGRRTSCRVRGRPLRPPASRGRAAPQVHVAAQEGGATISAVRSSFSKTRRAGTARRIRGPARATCRAIRGLATRTYVSPPLLPQAQLHDFLEARATSSRISSSCASFLRPRRDALLEVLAGSCRRAQLDTAGRRLLSLAELPAHLDGANSTSARRGRRRVRARRGLLPRRAGGGQRPRCPSATRPSRRSERAPTGWPRSCGTMSPRLRVLNRKRATPMTSTRSSSRSEDAR